MPHDPDRSLNVIVLDLSPHPAEAWAVIYHGKLLPIRFATDDQAFLHLREMLAADKSQKAMAA